MVTEGEMLYHLHRLELLQPCLLGYLVLSFVGIMLQMPHVGYIPDIADLVAKVPEQLEEHVVGHAGAGMAKVRFTVHGGAAHVHPDMSGIDGSEQFLLPAEGIGKVEISHVSKIIVMSFKAEGRG